MVNWQNMRHGTMPAPIYLLEGFSGMKMNGQHHRSRCTKSGDSQTIGRIIKSAASSGPRGIASEVLSSIEPAQGTRAITCRDLGASANARTRAAAGRIIEAVANSGTRAVADKVLNSTLSSGPGAISGRITDARELLLFSFNEFYYLDRFCQ